MSDETNVLQTTKKYVLLETRDDGTEVRQYENGMIRNQNGQALTLHPDMEAQQITADTARLYHAMRKAKILRAIEAGIQDVTKTKAPADAIGAIVKKRAKVAMTDNTRTGNEAARIVLQAVDAYQEKQEPTATSTIRHEYTMDDETRRLLHEIASRWRDDSAVDAEVSEE